MPLETYKLYDQILKFTGSAPQKTQSDFYRIFIDVHRKRGQTSEEIRESNKKQLEFQIAFKYLQDTEHIQKRSGYFMLTSLGQERLLKGFEDEYLEQESDKALTRKNLTVSIQLTEQQIIDIRKAKRRSWVAIGISLAVLLFEISKFVYNEYKDFKSKHEYRKTQRPPRKSINVPEIKNGSKKSANTIKKFSHKDFIK